MMDYIFEMEEMTVLLEDGGTEQARLKYHRIRMAGYAGENADASGLQPEESPACSVQENANNTDEKEEDEQK